MKKIVILLIIIAMIVIAGILFSKKDKNNVLSLKDCKTGEEFQFSKVPWKVSKKEAEDIIGSSLLEDSRRTPAPDGIEFYISDVEYLLNGMSTNASFEFHNDKLWIVQFYYNIDENPQEWFKSVIEELTALYGMETDKFTNTNGGTTNVGYKWDSNNTSFQIVSMMNQAAHMQVIISIGLCEV